MDRLLNFVSSYVLLFFVFAVFGWCMEVTLKFFQYHRFINRGFLIGPYCPIYGAGAVFVTLCVGAFARFEKSYGATFVISFIVCGALEYFISWYLEKKYHARWWDYSRKPMNLNGRIWMGNLVLFGIGGTLIVKIIDPVFFHLYHEIPVVISYVLAGLIGVIMITDNVVSHFVMKFVKSSVENSDADDTETISKEIHYLLTNRSVLHKRIADAYPNVVYRTDSIVKKMQAVREEIISDLKESPAEIRDDIIKRQEELIRLLEKGNVTEGELQELKKKLAEQKKAAVGTKEKIVGTEAATCGTLRQYDKIIECEEQQG